MPIDPTPPRHPSWSFSYTPTSVPMVFASNVPTLSYHTSSPMRDYKVFGKTYSLPLALDEPSSIFSLTRNLPLPGSMTSMRLRMCGSAGSATSHSATRSM